MFIFLIFRNRFSEGEKFNILHKKCVLTSTMVTRLTNYTQILKKLLTMFLIENCVQNKLLLEKMVWFWNGLYRYLSKNI